jgi:hypothetical protein
MLMRTLFLVVIASLSASSQSRRAPDTPELQAAKQPIESWMGLKLVIFDDGLPQKSEEPRRSTPREPVVNADSTSISSNQFSAGHELAEFLAHAAAHASLGHPERLVTLRKAVGILGPGRAGPVLQTETLATLEREAAPVVAEFMAKSGCSPATCKMFADLLQAVANVTQSAKSPASR